MPIFKPVAIKNIARIESFDFFSIAVVRSVYENYRPPRAAHPTRAVPESRPPAPRNSSAPLTVDDCEPSTTQATPFSLASTAVQELPLAPVVRLPADTAGLQARYLGTEAPQGRSTVLGAEVLLPQARDRVFGRDTQCAYISVDRVFGRNREQTPEINQTKIVNNSV